MLSLSTMGGNFSQCLSRVNFSGGIFFCASSCHWSWKVMVGLNVSSVAVRPPFKSLDPSRSQMPITPSIISPIECPWPPARMALKVHLCVPSWFGANDTTSSIDWCGSSRPVAGRILKCGTRSIRNVTGRSSCEFLIVVDSSIDSFVAVLMNSREWCASETFGYAARPVSFTWADMSSTPPTPMHTTTTSWSSVLRCADCAWKPRETAISGGWKTQVSNRCSRGARMPCGGVTVHTGSSYSMPSCLGT
mmetsp:Transcript_42575/g.101321  ORF Transcript_42575/g.101321 Transcript_42575/m.101321 type:complete len:248 (-) Transcript_42575:870-1613(-)